MEQWNISEQSKIISLKEINQQDKYKLSSRKKPRNFGGKSGGKTECRM